MDGQWINKKPHIWVECSNCRGQGFAHYDHCPWCGSRNTKIREELELCNYCLSIDNATPKSPRKKYKYCPECGRRKGPLRNATT